MQTVPTVKNNGYDVVFSPTDNLNYSSITINAVPITVQKAEPKMMSHPSLSAQYTEDNTLADLKLQNGFSWVTPSQKLIVLQSEYAAKYNPDPDNYNDFECFITVNVGRGSYNNISHPPISGYSTTNILKDVKLENGFSWINPSLALQAGTNEYPAKYNLNPQNYNDYNLNITITVGAAEATIISNPTASQITYGSYLHTSTLTGGQASVPGTFAWQNGNIVPTVKNSGYPVVFTPSDSKLGIIIINSVPITVEKGTYKSMNHEDLFATYTATNTLASLSQYLQEGFRWKDSSQKLLVSLVKYEAIYNLDPDNYYDLQLSISIYVSKGSYENVSHAALSGYTTSNTLSDVPLQDGFSWTDSSVKLLSGEHLYSAKYNPDPQNYEDYILNISVTATGQTPTILQAPSASEITYGSYLYTSTLTGGQASVSGTFYWENGDTIPTVNNDGYTVVFEPLDSSYSSITIERVPIVVLRASYNDIQHNALSAVYTSTNTLANVEGLQAGFSWISSSTKLTVSQSIYAAKYNLDPDNYNDFMLNITVNVSKGSYLDISHAPLSATYTSSNTLADIIGLESGFSWIEPSTKLIATVSYYTAKYNLDPDNYYDYHLSIVINVSKANYVGITHTALSAVYSPQNTLADVSGLSAGFAWINPSQKLTAAVSSYAAKYNFDPDNYNDFDLNITVNVSKASISVSQPVFNGALTCTDTELPTITTSTSGGTISLDDGQSLIAGSHAYYWTFTPDDTDNYEWSNLTGTITLTAAHGYGEWMPTQKPWMEERTCPIHGATEQRSTTIALVSGIESAETVIPSSTHKYFALNISERYSVTFVIAKKSQTGMTSILGRLIKVNTASLDPSDDEILEASLVTLASSTGSNTITLTLEAGYYILDFSETLGLDYSATITVKASLVSLNTKNDAPSIELPAEWTDNYNNTGSWYKFSLQDNTAMRFAALAVNSAYIAIYSSQNTDTPLHTLTKTSGTSAENVYYLLAGEYYIKIYSNSSSETIQVSVATLHSYATVLDGDDEIIFTDSATVRGWYKLELAKTTSFEWRLSTTAPSNARDSYVTLYDDSDFSNSSTLANLDMYTASRTGYIVLDAGVYYFNVISWQGTTTFSLKDFDVISESLTLNGAGADITLQNQTVWYRVELTQNTDFILTAEASYTTFIEVYKDIYTASYLARLATTTPVSYNRSFSSGTIYLRVTPNTTSNVTFKMQVASLEQFASSLTISTAQTVSTPYTQGKWYKTTFASATPVQIALEKTTSTTSGTFVLEIYVPGAVSAASKTFTLSAQTLSGKFGYAFGSGTYFIRVSSSYSNTSGTIKIININAESEAITLGVQTEQILLNSTSTEKWFKLTLSKAAPLSLSLFKLAEDYPTTVTASLFALSDLDNPIITTSTLTAPATVTASGIALTNGVYYIRIYNATPNMSISYITVSENFTSLELDTATTFTSVTSSGKYYKLVLTEATFVTLVLSNVTSSYLQTYLYNENNLSDALLMTSGSNSDSIYLPIGAYYVAVRSNNASYSVGGTFMLRTAEDITVGTPSVQTTFGTAGYYLKVDVALDGYYTLFGTTTSSIFYMYLSSEHNAKGYLLYATSGSALSPNYNANAYLEQGTYFIKVIGSATTSAGTVTLAVSDSLTNVTDISLDQTLSTGSVTNTSYAWYKLTLDTTLDIALSATKTSGSANFVVAVYRSFNTSTQLFNVSSSTIGSMAMTERRMEGGTYLIRVSSSSTAAVLGDFTISQIIVSNAPITLENGVMNDDVTVNSVGKIYRFTITSESAVEFTLNKKSGSPSLTASIYSDKSLTSVWSTAVCSSGTTIVPKILPAGEYYVKLHSSSTDAVMGSIMINTYSLASAPFNAETSTITLANDITWYKVVASESGLMLGITVSKTTSAGTLTGELYSSKQLLASTASLSNISSNSSSGGYADGFIVYVRLIRSDTTSAIDCKFKVAEELPVLTIATVSQTLTFDSSGSTYLKLVVPTTQSYFIERYKTAAAITNYIGFSLRFYLEGNYTGEPVLYLSGFANIGKKYDIIVIPQGTYYVQLGYLDASASTTGTLTIAPLGTNTLSIGSAGTTSTAHTSGGTLYALNLASQIPNASISLSQTSGSLKMDIIAITSEVYVTSITLTGSTSGTFNLPAGNNVYVRLYSTVAGQTATGKVTITEPAITATLSNGSYSTSATINQSGNYYKFTLSDAAFVTISLNKTAQSGTATMYANSSGFNTVSVSTTTGTATSSPVLLAPGTYYIRVTSSSSSYTVTGQVRFNVTSPTSLSIGSTSSSATHTISGTLYKLTASDAVYMLSMTSTAGSYSLNAILYRAINGTLEQAGSYYCSANAVFGTMVKLEAGTYYVLLKCAGYSSDTTTGTIRISSPTALTVNTNTSSATYDAAGILYKVSISTAQHYSIVKGTLNGEVNWQVYYSNMNLIQENYTSDYMYLSAGTYYIRIVRYTYGTGNPSGTLKLAPATTTALTVGNTTPSTTFNSSGTNYSLTLTVPSNITFTLNKTSQTGASELYYYLFNQSGTNLVSALAKFNIGSNNSTGTASFSIFLDAGTYVFRVACSSTTQTYTMTGTLSVSGIVGTTLTEDTVNNITYSSSYATTGIYVVPENMTGRDMLVRITANSTTSTYVNIVTLNIYDSSNLSTVLMSVVLAKGSRISYSLINLPSGKTYYITVASNSSSGATFSLTAPNYNSAQEFDISSQAEISDVSGDLSFMSLFVVSADDYYLSLTGASRNADLAIMIFSANGTLVRACYGETTIAVTLARGVYYIAYYSLSNSSLSETWTLTLTDMLTAGKTAKVGDTITSGEEGEWVRISIVGSSTKIKFALTSDSSNTATVYYSSGSITSNMSSIVSTSSSASYTLTLNTVVIYLYITPHATLTISLA